MPTRKDPLSAVPATPTRQKSDSPTVAVIPSPERKDSLSSSNSNSTPPTPTIKQQSHICQSCGRGFSRAEHLDRHLATHLPPSEAKTYICTLCTKGFTRKDVLSRHIKAVHQTKKVEVKKSRRRSCIRCAGFKIKCSSGASKGRTVVAPCDACAKRGHECVFDADSDLKVIRRESLNDPTEADINDEEDDDIEEDEDEMNAMDIMEIMDINDPLESSTQPPSRSGEIETREPSLKRRRTIDEGTSSSFSVGHSSLKSIDSGIGSSSSKSSQLGSAAQILSKQENGSGSTYPHYNPNLPGFGGPPPPVSYSHYFTPNRGSSSSTSLSSSPSFTSFPHAQLPRGYVDREARRASAWPVISSDEYQAADALNGLMPGSRSLDPFSYFEATKRQGQGNNTEHFESREPAMLSSLQLIQKLEDPAENTYFDPSIFELDFLREDFYLHSIAEEPSFERSDKSRPGYLSPVQQSVSKSPSLNTSIPPSSNWLTKSANHSPQDRSPKGLEGPRYQPEIRLPQVNSTSTYLAEDSLPWDWQTSSNREPRIILPPLRELLQAPQGYHRQAGLQRGHEIGNTYRDNRPPKKTIVTDKVRKDMLTVLKAPYERLPVNNVDLREEKFPANEVLNEFIQLYLKSFHNVLPMLHIPTFTPESCPNFLLVTIATIGARYHTSESAIEFADNLNALCHKALTWLGEYNEDYKRSASYLMAFSLSNVYALGAGNKRLFEMTDATRSYVINACRNLGLFGSSGRPSLPRQKTTSEEPFLPAGDVNDPEKVRLHWLAWKEEEFKKRLAWSVFECDCSISCLTNRRGNIALSDLCLPLPCDEALWEAPDAQTWAALYPRYKSTPPRGMPFYFVLRDIMNGHQDQLSLSSWGRRICAQGIGRMIWDIRELETSLLGRLVQLPVLSVGLKPAKDDLLKALMVVLGTSPNEDSTMVDSSMTAIIAHYSHLYATRDVVDLAISLAKHSSSSGKFRERMERINKIKGIFTSDTVKARELAWHAGQILAAGRRYNIHTSCDCLRVFIAGVYLYAFAKYFPTTQYLVSVSEEHSAAPLDDSVKLDSLCTSYSDAIKHWIKNGGKARLEHVGDLQSFEGRREVLRLVESLLQRMKLWGICEKFLKVVQELLQSD